MENKRNSSSRRAADTVLCRACLADCRPQQTKFLFGKWQPPTKSPVTDASNITIADMLCDITKTTVKPGDKYPDHICSTCFEHFWTARTFIHRVRQSDKIMRKNWKYFQVNYRKVSPPSKDSQLDRSITRNASSRAKILASANNEIPGISKKKDEMKNVSETTKNKADKTKNKSEKIKSKNSISDHLTQLVKKSPVVVLEKLMLDELKKEWEIKEEIDIKNEILSDTENESTFPNVNQTDVTNGYESMDMNTEIKVEEQEQNSQDEKEVLKEYPRIVATRGADVNMQTRSSKKQLRTDEKKLGASTKHLSTNENMQGAADRRWDTNTLLVKTGEVPAQLREGEQWTNMHEMYVKEELDEEDMDIDLMCILCSKSFMTIAGLKAHVVSTHSYKWAVRVHTLTQQLSSKAVLSEAEALHCKICSKAFETSDLLKVHMEGHVQRAREMAAEKKGLGRNGRPRACKSTSGGAFHCVGCNLQQPTYKLLLLHAATCPKRLQLMGRLAKNGDIRAGNHASDSPSSRPKENSEESTEEDSQMENKNVYKCNKCNQVFDGSLYLKIHNEIHHTALNGDSTLNSLPSEQPMEE